MGHENDLIAGFAQMLADASVASWSTTGAYSASATGIFVEVMPPAPDGAVMLSTYPVSDDPTLSNSVLGLQVHTRTAGQDPRTTNDLADQIFDQFQSYAGTLSTGVRVLICERRSGVLLGQDDLLRWVRSDNYYVTTWRPSLHRQ